MEVNNIIYNSTFETQIPDGYTLSTETINSLRSNNYQVNIIEENNIRKVQIGLGGIATYQEIFFNLKFDTIGNFGDNGLKEKLSNLDNRPYIYGTETEVGGDVEEYYVESGESQSTSPYFGIFRIARR